LVDPNSVTINTDAADAVEVVFQALLVGYAKGEDLWLTIEDERRISTGPMPYCRKSRYLF